MVWVFSSQMSVSIRGTVFTDRLMDEQSCWKTISSFSPWYLRLPAACRSLASPQRVQCRIGWRVLSGVSSGCSVLNESAGPSRQQPGIMTTCLNDRGSYRLPFICWPLQHTRSSTVHTVWWYHGIVWYKWCLSQGGYIWNYHLCLIMLRINQGCWSQSLTVLKALTGTTTYRDKHL